MSSETPPLPDDHPIVQTVAEPLHQLLKRNAAEKQSTGDEAGLSTTVRFQPLGRQPLVKLTILDDGTSDSGETIRIRDTACTIGRDTGNVMIPFDSDMSAQHAELRCRSQLGEYRWFLIDSDSTNGTFLRAYRASLRDGTELMLGSRRYRFQGPASGETGRKAGLDETIIYKPPSAAELNGVQVHLVEVGDSSSHTFPIHDTDVLVGRDSTCQIMIDDPGVSPQHARIYRDKRRRWMIEDRSSLNGVWIRVNRIALDHRAEFQLGQQRFLFEQR